MIIQAYAVTSNAEEAEVECFYEDLQELLELTPPKDVLLIMVDWYATVGGQEIPGVKGKFGLGVQNEAGQRLTESFVLFLICGVPYSSGKVCFLK